MPDYTETAFYEAVFFARKSTAYLRLSLTVADVVKTGYNNRTYCLDSSYFEHELYDLDPIIEKRA